MKSFVVYVKGHSKSEEYMDQCLKSCISNDFEAEPLEGVTPKTLNNYKHYPEIPNGRATSFKKESKKTYETKKSCFLNHVRVWNKCIELDEPVAFIEQDATCVRPWNNTIFNDVLILNCESAFKQPVFDHVRNKPKFNFGKGLYNSSPLVYNKDNSFKGGLMIPGTAAYAVTPKGAKKLLSQLDKFGWDQSDYFINTCNVNLEYITPEYFTFSLKNLNMSHGF